MGFRVVWFENLFPIAYRPAIACNMAQLSMIKLNKSLTCLTTLADQVCCGDDVACWTRLRLTCVERRISRYVC